MKPRVAVGRFAGYTYVIAPLATNLQHIIVWRHEENDGTAMRAMCMGSRELARDGALKLILDLVAFGPSPLMVTPQYEAPELPAPTHLQDRPTRH